MLKQQQANEEMKLIETKAVAAIESIKASWQGECKTRMSELLDAINVPEEARDHVLLDARYAIDHGDAFVVASDADGEKALDKLPRHACQ